MGLSFFFSFFLAIFCAGRVSASETHTIKFINQCGYGTPCLVVNGKNVSTGADYTTQDLFSGIAYLQTGPCKDNGEECTLMEMNLANPSCPGCGSSVDISLISPHVFNVGASFSYYNGCDGLGAFCNDPNCPEAFFAPEDWSVQRQCEANNVNLLIAFCANASEIILGGSAPSSSSSSSSSSSAQITPTPITATPVPGTTTQNTNLSGTPSSSSSSTSNGSTPTTSPKTCRSRRTSTPSKREPKGFAVKKRQNV